MSTKVYMVTLGYYRRMQRMFFDRDKAEAFIEEQGKEQLASAGIYTKEAQDRYLAMAMRQYDIQEWDVE